MIIAPVKLLFDFFIELNREVLCFLLFILFIQLHLFSFSACAPLKSYISLFISPCDPSIICLNASLSLM